MSEQDKNYAPEFWIRSKYFEKSGKTILNVSIKTEAFCAWLRSITDDKGYARLGISERKQLIEGKPTHTCWQDTWKPDRERVVDKHVDGGVSMHASLNRTQQPQPAFTPETTRIEDQDNLPF